MILTGIYFLNSLDFGVVFMFHILRKKKKEKSIKMEGKS